MLSFLRQNLSVIRPIASVSSSRRSSSLPFSLLSTFAFSPESSMGETANSNPGAVADAKLLKDQAYLDAVTEKRVKMFQVIQAEQIAEREKIGGQPIKITLPDGSVKEGKKWITSPMDIAKGISTGLAASALIAQVNGSLWDMTRPLEEDCKLKLFKFEDRKSIFIYKPARS